MPPWGALVLRDAPFGAPQEEGLDTLFRDLEEFRAFLAYLAQLLFDDLHLGFEFFERLAIMGDERQAGGRAFADGIQDDADCRRFGPFGWGELQL